METKKQEDGETVSAYISRWRAKVAQMVARPKEQEQIQMILWNLRPQFARQMVGNSNPNFRALVQAGIDVEEGFSRGLWSESTLNDQKGKRQESGFARQPEVNVVDTQQWGPTSPGYLHSKGHRSAHYRPNQYAHHRPIPTQYSHAHHQYPQPTFWCPQTTQTHVHAIQTPPPFNSRPPQDRAPRVFTNLGMSLSCAFEKLLAATKIAPLPPK